MSRVWVSSAFDDLRPRQARFLQAAAQMGSVHVLLWADRLVKQITGAAPRFPQAERHYFVSALRSVSCVAQVQDVPGLDHLPLEIVQVGDGWAYPAEEENAARRDFCLQQGIIPYPIGENDLSSSALSLQLVPSERKKVMVTGSFDWLHTGHVRFFEEVSGFGDLIVVVGHDDNIRLLKGAGHPLFSQAERLYIVQAIRFVSQAMLSSGHGWLDAEPELERIQPDIYAVNEDGDKPEKQAYCRTHGIEYLVLKRTPKIGLSSRSSTALRGF